MHNNILVHKMVLLHWDCCYDSGVSQPMWFTTAGVIEEEEGDCVHGGVCMPECVCVCVCMPECVYARVCVHARTFFSGAGGHSLLQTFSKERHREQENVELINRY